MSVEKKKGEPIAVKRKKWRYFFYRDKLHRTLKIVRSRDEITAWCYPDHQEYMYAWSDVQRRAEIAKTTRQAAEVMDLDPNILRGYVQKQYVPMPQRSYKIEDEQKYRNGYRLPQSSMYWSYKDIERVNDIRKNFGRYKRGSKRYEKFAKTDKEIKAAALHGIFMYTKNKDGQFIPIWEAEEY